MRTFFVFLKQWFLLGLILFLLVLFYLFHLQDYLSFDMLKSYQASVTVWANTHYVFAVAIYLAIFTLVIALTIPGATFLSLVAGFLFGSIGIIYAIAGTTLGGLVLFYAVRTAVGSYIAKKRSGWIKRMEKGFQKNAFHYILMLRLFPIFPCWISNIAAGALNIPVSTFILATVIGVTPASVIYVMIGRGLDKIFASNQTPSLSLLLTPSLFYPLLALAILSLIPVFYKRLKKP